MYPSAMHVMTLTIGSEFRLSTVGSAFYGFVHLGSVEVRSLHAGIKSLCNAGAFFVINNEVVLRAATLSQIAIIERLGYQAMQICGVVESKGRLTYIDDCSDTILSFPARMGDPCLNHLHFPKGILQSQHTHPSIRLGIIFQGNGYVWGPNFKEPLEQGMVFCLDEGERHSFMTTDNNTMDVIAFHPDSDWGPTDMQHPMLNRTYIVAKGRYGENT
jgi:hypothetical protein